MYLTWEKNISLPPLEIKMSLENFTKMFQSDEEDRNLWCSDQEAETCRLLFQKC